MQWFMEFYMAVGYFCYRRIRYDFDLQKYSSHITIVEKYVSFTVMEYSYTSFASIHMIVFRLIKRSVGSMMMSSNGNIFRVTGHL